jgi:nitrite reductase/ring-hydroxylating ferredoxin subunit
MAVTYVPVAELDELTEKNMKAVKVAGRDMVVTLLDGQPVAFDRSCPHEGWYLEKGVISGRSVYCEDHSWAFDVTTGECTQPVGGPMLALFPIEEHEGKWCVRVET